VSEQTSPAPSGDEPRRDEVPLLDENERDELRRLDAQILAGRDRPPPGGSVHELKYMLYISNLLMVLTIGAYMTLYKEDRRDVATWMSIVGFVLCGWGTVRGVHVARASASSLAGMGWMYAVIFATLMLIFGLMVLGLAGVFA
jgi:hypothetical protein